MKKIFFSASTYVLPEFIENYLEIVSTIKKNGGELVLDWTKDWQEIVKRYRKEGKKKMKNADIYKIIDRKKFFEIHMKKIQECDAMVAEVTQPSTSVGYQLFFAISHKKPVLALYSDEANTIDINKIKSIINTESPLLFLKKYNKNSLYNTIKSFLKKRNDVLKKFNFLISEEIENYVEWLIKKNPDKSRSELLREKILDEIIINDKEYQRYLNNL